jgi:uncharacterized membrane protein YjgN (DUF898 family)
MQFAVYRARRYRLTRTLWRGVRFWMNGSGLAYASRAFGWALLVVATLGIAYPWREAALERYKMGHTIYGDLASRFDGTGWEFFKRGWWLWLLSIATIAVVVVSLIVLVVDAEAARHNHIMPPRVHAWLGVVSFLSFLCIPFIYAAFKATEWKWWVQGIRFGLGPRSVRFDSDLRRGALVGTIWKMIGAGLLVVLAAIIAIAVAYGVMTAFGIDTVKIGAEHGSPPLALGILAVVAYLASFLALGVVWRIYLVQRIWKLVVASITLHHLDVADHVVAKGGAANALGEGLVDALDFAGF